MDCICCGFGAIILMLTLSKMGEPRALEQARLELEGRLARLEEELHVVRGEAEVLDRELRARVRQLSEERARVARLQGDMSKLQGEFAASKELSAVSELLEGRLLAAQQTLTEEMKRLQAESERRPIAEALVAGVPVDSEYIVFVIDTSGSMQRYAWPALNRKMAETLDAYPKVKGMQVMNDQGEYMFKTYAGKWIPDTPARRQAVLERLRGWNAMSKSSPAEGIEAAIRLFATADKKVGIYVLGDEFTGSSIDSVVRAVDRMNRRTTDGRRRARIHAIGFPTIFSQSEAPDTTGVRFATLMRLLCDRNGGAFVGLSTLAP
jgi:hypothetical protein